MIESCHGSTEQTAPQALGVSVNLNRRLVASTFSYPTRDRTNSKLLVADRATVASVTGFGRRPPTHLTTRTTGPAFESRQGTKSRGVGHPSQRGLWGFRWRCRSSAGFLKLAAPVESSTDTCFDATPCSGLRSCRLKRCPCDAIIGRSGRAPSLPVIDQQHRRAAFTGETGVRAIMTCRSGSPSPARSACFAASSQLRTTR